MWFMIFELKNGYYTGSDDSMRHLESYKTRLINEIERTISEPAREWLRDALRVLSTSENISDDLALYSAMAKRKLGSAYLKQANAIDTQLSPVNIQRWTCADAGRLILLMSAIECRPDQSESIISRYYKMADNAERIALIHGLIFFAPADYLTEIALDAGRTNNLELLAALTLDNPYPACFYSDKAFNQMVLKALFQGLAIERVEGLGQRANADMARMGENYVVERENAGRSVPVDIWLAIGPCASETGNQQMMGYLSHDDIGHRYYCALALSQRLSQQPALAVILKKRLEIEQEALIIKRLQECLSAE